MAEYSGISKIQTAQMARSLQSLADILKVSERIQEQNTVKIVALNAEEKLGAQRAKVVTAENPDIGGNIDVST